MPTYSMDCQVNKVIFAISALTLMFLSCEKIEPDLDNPLDPNNPDYEPPIVSIIAGPTDGETVDTSSVIFEWEGNELSRYRYKFSDNDWTAFIPATIVEFDYLDEGQYTFLLQAWYTNGDTSLIVSRSFTVDAVQGPALMFYPRRQFASIGDTVTFQILAEEVENLTAAEMSISFDPASLDIVSIDQGTIFSSNGESLFHTENGSGTLSILTAILGGDDPSVNGIGDLAIIEVSVLQTWETSLSFDGSEVFRNPENNSISISETIGGLISTP